MHCTFQRWHLDMRQELCSFTCMFIKHNCQDKVEISVATVSVMARMLLWVKFL